MFYCNILPFTKYTRIFSPCLKKKVEPDVAVVFGLAHTIGQELAQKSLKRRGVQRFLQAAKSLLREVQMYIVPSPI